MQDLSPFLTPITVEVSQLLLDPNNPRFAELGEDRATVPESRFHEDRVQQTAMRNMSNAIFDVAELRETMLGVGYLPMDRLVVRRLQQCKPDGSSYFVVVEGNRRLTALRQIGTLHEEGKITLDDEWLERLRRIEVLELSPAAPKTAMLVLPGLRHVSGIKEWGAYQKARAVCELRDSGLSPQEAAQSLGLSTMAANRAYRCFMALQQMKDDEEFGEYANAKLYSYFEEMFKRPNVKTWLDWDDEAMTLKDEKRRREFYSWIVPQDGESSPRLTEAKSVRDLGLIIEDPEALAMFSSEAGSLQRALPSVSMMGETS